MLNLKKVLTKLCERQAGFTDIASMSEVSAPNYSGCQINMNDGHSIRFMVGKLDASTNYLQFFIDGVDKGYIKFDVNRNV